MGTEFYLVNHETKEIVDLGKGSLGLLDKPTLSSKESLKNFFSDEIIYDGMTPATVEYYMKVLEMIWDFVNDSNLNMVEVLTEEYYVSKEYKFVNSRYLLSDPEKHLERLTWLNDNIRE